MVSVGFSTPLIHVLENTGWVSVTLELEGLSAIPLTVLVAMQDDVATGDYVYTIIILPSST